MATTKKPTTKKAALKKPRTKITVEYKRARAAKKVEAMIEFQRYGIPKQPVGKITGSKALPANPLTIDDQQHPTVRPGSMTALAIPTRVGDYLHYRDGSRRLDPIAAKPRVDLYSTFNRG